MSIPVPRQVLDKYNGPSTMACKSSQLPSVFSFVNGSEGRVIFFNAYIGVIITERKVAGKIERCMDVFFYEHTFSMFSASEGLKIQLGDMMIELPCGEALVHMLKAAKFADWEAFWKIYYSDTPRSCKQQGNKVTPFNDVEWLKIAPEVMSVVARLKLACKDVFDCYYALAIACQSHGIKSENFRAFECSPRDDRYGIGMSIENAMNKAQKAPLYKAHDKDDEVPCVFDDVFLLDTGKNILGEAVAKAFGIFVLCGGVDCSGPDDLISNYKKLTGTSIFETALLKVQNVSSPKKAKTDATLKTDDTASMDSEDVSSPKKAKTDATLKTDDTASMDSEDVQPATRSVSECIGRSLSCAPAGELAEGW
jgi:predicted NAD-dependent protein-ADP-ribosyltransferase YbiA (DUF1768 family)